MKPLKLLSIFIIFTSMITSCTVNDSYDQNYNPSPNLSLSQLLGSYDLWYVDIDQTLGYGQTPFMEIAFTLSFKNGRLYANNNLVGIGTQGNGLGIQVGTFSTFNDRLRIDHYIDGYQSFEVYQINSNTIEIYNPYNDTSYFLKGYQKYNFDYDFVFYDNIHYFLQEYKAWERSNISSNGYVNPFDNENYLQFLAGGNDSEFRSSQDFNVPINSIVWDYTGVYGIGNVSNNMYLKTLTLDYDYFDNEFFELSVINDQRIRLYQPSSGTTYEFTGRGYIEFMKSGNVKDSDGKIQYKDEAKKRKQKTIKKQNPRQS